MILVLFFMDNLVEILGGSENTGIFTKQYLSIVAIGFPAAIVGYVANAGIRSNGNPKMSMATLLIGAIINIVLDPIFIFGFNMGVKGAALGPISQYVSAIWTIYYFNSRFSGLKLYISNFLPRFRRMKDITLWAVCTFCSSSRI